MAKDDLRTEARLARTRRATLTFNGASASALIQDVSVKGFLIMATKRYSVGDVLALRTELYPGQVLECKVAVRHVTDDNCLGTQISEIGPSGSRLCRQFIEEHYAQKLNFTD